MTNENNRLGVPRGGASTPKEPDSELECVRIEDIDPTYYRPVPRAVKRFKPIHHDIADFLAHDNPVEDVAITVGYSYAWICRLQSDEAFKQLVAYYRFCAGRD